MEIYIFILLYFLTLRCRICFKIDFLSSWFQQFFFLSLSLTSEFTKVRFVQKRLNNPLENKDVLFNSIIALLRADWVAGKAELPCDISSGSL